MIKKKKIAGLAVIVAALSACGAMSYAWFTSTLDPVNTNVTTGKILIEATGLNEWSIGGDPDLIGAALPGETVKHDAFTIENKSTREALVEVETVTKAIIPIANQTWASDWSAVASVVNGLINNTAIINFYVSGPSDSRDSYEWRTLTADEIARLKAVFDPAATEYVVDRLVFDFLNSSDWGKTTVQSAIKAVSPSALTYVALLYGTVHILGVIDNIQDQIRDEMDTAILASGITVSLTTGTQGYEKWYYGLGTTGNLDFSGGFEYKIPNDLGGNLIDDRMISDGGYTNITQFDNYPIPPLTGPSINKHSYNWDSTYLNEQEAKIAVGFNIKAVQGTKKAVADVFGTAVANDPVIDTWLTDY